MTAAAAARVTPEYASKPFPAAKSLGVKAATTIYKGTMVAVDSTGYALPAATDTDHRIQGVAKETVDNSAGANAAKTVEVAVGIFLFANSAAADLIAQAQVGQPCFIVDDNTVAKTDGTGTRSRAGNIEGVETAGVWVSIHPYGMVNGQATLTGAETLTNKTITAPTIADASNIAAIADYKGTIEIELGSITDADGDQAKFANGGADGMTIADSKAVCYRINNAGPAPKNLFGFGVPADADVTANMTLYFMCSKSGATVGDATTIDVELFNQVDGALHDADADYGGTTALGGSGSGALTGDAVAKTIDVIGLTLALANLPVVGSKVSGTFTPTNGTLGTDDLMIHRIWVEYTKQVS